MTTDNSSVTGAGRGAPGRWTARVLCLAQPAEIAAEIERITGKATAYRADAYSAAQLRFVAVTGGPPGAAHEVCRHMSALGGQGFGPQVSAGARAVSGSCLLLGTIAQYGDLCARLSASGDLASAASEIARALEAFDSPALAPLRCGERVLPVGERALVMGVINATPDSFSGDGLAGDVSAMVARGEQMAAEGADLIDIGGESTRPGAQPIDTQVEIARVVPVIRALRQRVGTPISIDTYKPAVARAALDAGAAMINDITALRHDPAMAALAAERGVPVVVMHMQGTPQTMQQNPRYHDLMGEIATYLRESVDLAVAAGVPRDQVVIDPGFGFGKTVNHNLEIVRRLRELRSLGQAVLLGPSRKSTIGKVLDLPPEQRLEGTLAVLALAVANGANIVRVHDVRAAIRAVRMTEAVQRGWREE